jgi:hypothetical protein
MKIRLLHTASIPNARWCEPIGWEPKNHIEGAEWQDNAWWDEDNEVASLVWYGEPNAYGVGEVIDADLADLRVARSGECRVIGEVHA